MLNNVNGKVKVNSKLDFFKMVTCCWAEQNWFFMLTFSYIFWAALGENKNS